MRGPLERTRTVRPAPSSTVTTTRAGERSVKVTFVRSARPSPFGEIAAGVAFAARSDELTAIGTVTATEIPPGAVPRIANR